MSICPFQIRTYELRLSVQPSPHFRTEPCLTISRSFRYSPAPYGSIRLGREGPRSMGYFTSELSAPAVAPGFRVEWEESACLLCAGRHWLPLVESADDRSGGSG